VRTQGKINNHTRRELRVTLRASFLELPATGGRRSIGLVWLAAKLDWSNQQEPPTRPTASNATTARHHICVTMLPDFSSVGRVNNGTACHSGASTRKNVRRAAQKLYLLWWGGGGGGGAERKWDCCTPSPPPPPPLANRLNWPSACW
jgi:hypothetical protein